MTVPARLRNIVVAILGMVALAAGSVSAAPIKLGTATGGLMIYYNNVDKNGAGGLNVPDGVVSGYDENANNQAYIQAHFGYSAPGYAGSNTNGMGFQFDTADLGGFSWNSIFSGQPAGSSQFGFDLLAPALTYSAAGGVVLPTGQFADNTGGAPAYTPVVGPSWGINDYKPNAPNGPGTVSNVNYNSLFRGTGFTLSIDGFTVTPDTDQNGTVRPRYYTIDISGTLVTDGLIHWFNPALPNTPLAGWGLTSTLSFDGTLTLDSFYGKNAWGTPANTYAGLWLENGSDQRDFYAGAIDIYVQPVPEPGTVLLLGSGLLGLVAATVRRRLKR